MTSLAWKRRPKRVKPLFGGPPFGNFAPSETKTETRILTTSTTVSLPEPISLEGIIQSIRVLLHSQVGRIPSCQVFGAKAALDAACICIIVLVVLPQHITSPLRNTSTKDFKKRRRRDLPPSPAAAAARSTTRYPPASAAGALRTFSRCLSVRSGR